MEGTGLRSNLHWRNTLILYEDPLADGSVDFLADRRVDPEIRRCLGRDLGDDAIPASSEQRSGVVRPQSHDN